MDNPIQNPQLEARWERLQGWIDERFGRQAGIEGILFLIGVQTRGRGFEPDLEKEAKERLIMEGAYRVFETLGDQGHARLLAWWALSGSTPDGPGEAEGEPPMMRELAESVLEDLRAARAESGGPAPDADDAVFAVRLAAAALFGEALLGPLLSRSGGLPDGPETSVRFRRWLAELLERGLG